LTPRAILALEVAHEIQQFAILSIRTSLSGKICLLHSRLPPKWTTFLRAREHGISADIVPRHQEILDRAIPISVLHGTHRAHYDGAIAWRIDVLALLQLLPPLKITTGQDIMTVANPRAIRMLKLLSGL